MKRGGRGLPITRDKRDQERFTRLLYFLNDEHRDEYWERTTISMRPFERPNKWPERQPLTKVLAWVLMPNHFHLLLEEIKEGGISTFMQRLCGSMSAHFNSKYQGKGSIFQGGYKGRTIGRDEHFRQLVPYIMVKNVFEMYPGGYEKAVKEFDKAWKWGINSYPYSSLPEYAGHRDTPVIEKGIIADLFPTPTVFKNHARETILNRGVKDTLEKLAIDEWGSRTSPD
jgi:putative transposase